MTPKPTPPPPCDLTTLPALAWLTDDHHRRWVSWQYRLNKKQDDWTKPPIGLEGQNAASDNSLTWCSYAQARALMVREGYDGLGLMLANLLHVVAIDLDDVRDTATGKVLPWAQALIRSGHTYCEMTPSGGGFRIIGTSQEIDTLHRGKTPHPEGGSFEIYCNTNRYITVSGQVQDHPADLADITHLVRHLEGLAPPRKPSEGNGHDPEAGFDRSAEFARLARIAKASGMSLGQTLAALEAYGEKYGSRGPAELERIWVKIALRPDPEDRTDDATGGRVSDAKPIRGERFGRLIVLSINDIDTAPPRDYLLKGLISPGEISIWVGPPKCGKSFLLLYVAYMLSLGRRVFGRRVKPTRVLYVAAEGEAGIANRLRALRIRHGHSDNFHFIAQPADLLHDAGDKESLIAAAAAHRAQLIVLDTLSRLLAGGDENSPQDMGTFIRNAGEVRYETGVHLAIVHHGTKASSGSNPRGHSSLTGADDAHIDVARLEDGSRLATVVHAKDDADGMRWGFKLEYVELGIDEDGDPITTLIAVETMDPPVVATRNQRLSDNLQIGLKTLHAALKASGVILNIGDGEPDRKAVAEADWRAWFYREGMPGESQDTKKKAFQRIVAGLLAKGLVNSRDGYLWPSVGGS